MNLIKYKNTPQRNITPNFVRFNRKQPHNEGKKNITKANTPEESKGEEIQQTDRSSSKASRCSF